MEEVKFRLFGKNSKEFLGEKPYGLTLKELQNVADLDAWHKQQFTGLEDANGVEIYEGDILEVKIGCWKQDKPYVVEDLRELYLETNRDDRYYRITSMKIIGNIYENPELIEANHGKD